jgi:hypothetical protein
MRWQQGASDAAEGIGRNCAIYDIISGGILAITSNFVYIVKLSSIDGENKYKTNLDELPVLGNPKVFRCGILLIVVWTAYKIVETGPP